MSEENDSPELPSPAAGKQPVRKPTPKLALPKLPARKIVLNAPSAIPASKVKLMSAGGKPVAPTKAAAPAASSSKPSAAAAKKDAPPPEEEARRHEEEEARLRAEEEKRLKAEEEYNRQMEEYNRQMEEYNRQMEEIRRQEEEARRLEEEEARRKAEEEARKRAEEGKKKQAALAAQLKAEKEAKRKAAEAIRLQAEAARLEAEAAQMEAEVLRTMAGNETIAPAQSAKNAGPKPKLTHPGAAAKTSAIPTTKAGSAHPKLTLPGSAKTAVIPGAAQQKPTLPGTTATTVAMPDAKDNAAPGQSKLMHPGLSQAKQTDEGAAPIPKPKLSLPTELTRTAAGATLASEAAAQEDAPPGAEPSEEEQAARNAYYSKLQQQAAQMPLYKKKGVLIGLGAFIVLVGVLGAMVVNNRMETAAKEEFRQSVNRLLRVSQEINKAGVETLAQAKAKNIDLKNISMENADTLLGSIHNPAKYGGIGVAQNAALFLGIMAEADERIQNKLFADLAKNAATINPTLFNWMLQRLSVSGIGSVKNKMLTLSDKITKKPKFKNQAKAIASIWEVLALHVDEKDVPRILDLLKNPKTDEAVTKSLANSLMSIVLHAKNPQELPSLGDRIFEAVPEKRRGLVGQILANARSPKALAWIKNELKDQKKWALTLPLLGIWGDDSVLDYLLEQLGKAKEADPRYRLPTHVEGAIKNLLNKDRDRPLELADKMIAIAFDKVGTDTSDYISVRDKTEEGGVDYVEKGSPDYDKLQARRKELDSIRLQKLQFVNMLGGLQNHPWVAAWFDKLAKDPDEDLQIEVKAAREKAAENTKKAAAKAAAK